ncbi:MAG: hypothetical protein Q4A43_02260 [Coriobacteriia bacterium]|nr:hypothetical protein [Coriobacteriia bacterium]
MSYQNRNHRRSLSSFSLFFQEWQDQLPSEVKAKLSHEKAVERIYAQFSCLVNDFILEHVNAVYLLNPQDEKEAAPDAQKPLAQWKASKPYKKRLIVYVDNSLVAAELGAQKELLKLKYLSEFNVELVEFEVNISKGRYRIPHPFVDRLSERGHQLESSHTDCTEEEIVSRETLTQYERERIDGLTEQIEDPRLKKSFERAIAATFNKKRKLSGKDA